MECIIIMNINDIEDVKGYYEEFKKLYESGENEKAAEMMKELLENLENNINVRKAGSVSKNDVIAIGGDKDSQKDIYISLNHVMEYYIYAYYFKPEVDVKCTELPYNEYYRTYGALCMTLGKYNAAKEAYIHAIEWNPVDLDSILGLAECYKYIGKLERYIAVTVQGYRYCCTRATMARYYRNMGYYNLSKYKTDIARACYIYSNIYYHTDNADSELKYLESALNDKTPKLDIKTMQKIFDENGIEPGPQSDTIGVIYRVGELMMQDNDNKLAKDCFSIVYDITQEKALEALINEL
jgi:tetratricopeptide (TPR) repeat protein